MQIFSRLLGKHWGRLLKQSKLQNLVVNDDQWWSVKWFRDENRLATCSAVLVTVDKHLKKL